jgi:hypothetical protein
MFERPTAARRPRHRNPSRHDRSPKTLLRKTGSVETPTAATPRIASKTIPINFSGFSKALRQSTSWARFLERKGQPSREQQSALHRRRKGRSSAEIRATGPQVFRIEPPSEQERVSIAFSCTSFRGAFSYLAEGTNRGIHLTSR